MSDSDDDNDGNISILHLNIRSSNKNFEHFKIFLSNLNFSFSIICFSETWLNDSNVDISNYKLPNHVSVCQIRKHYRRTEVSVYTHKNIKFTIRDDLSINCKDSELVGLGLEKREEHFNVVYRQTNNKIEPFENFFKIFLIKTKTPKKIIILQEFSILTSFLNLIYQNGLLPNINKSTRVTTKIVTAINYIIANSFAVTY